MTEEDKIRQIVKEEISNLFKLDRYSFGKLVQFNDGINIQVGSTTGTKIGTSATQKLGFFAKAPIVQPGAISAPTGGGSGDTDAIDTHARTAINSIRTALTNLGLTA